MQKIFENRNINGVSGGATFIEKVITTQQDYKISLSQILLDGKVILNLDKNNLSIKAFTCQYVNEARIDDTVYYSEVNNAPSEYSNMKFYSPFQHPPINGLIKNLKIEMFDDDPAANVPLGEIH